MTHQVTLIGAPSDIGAGTRGASMGPEALRVAGIHGMLETQGLDVRDRGDLRGPANPLRGPEDGYRHLDEVTQWNRAVHDAVHRELADARMPILLGGDHSLSIGSISATARSLPGAGPEAAGAMARRACRFQHQRAHPQRQHSRHAGGMPVRARARRASSKCPDGCPAIQPSSIRQIGIRSVDQGEKRLVHEVGLEVFDMRFIDETGMRQTLANALESLDRDTHLHVSFDVDFLDPEIAPGVGTTVPGGPSYREAQLCMEMIADTGLLGSLDIMELNPSLDLRNRTADGGGRSGRLAVRQEHADAARNPGPAAAARGLRQAAEPGRGRPSGGSRAAARGAFHCLCRRQPRTLRAPSIRSSGCSSDW